MPLDPAHVRALYDRLVPALPDPAKGRIHPFVGTAYTTEPDALRVLAVGINGYVDDGATSQPSWFTANFAELKYTFYERVLGEVTVIAQALAPSSHFHGRRFLGKESVYLTNAVKRWLPKSEGLRARHVPDALFQEGESVFRAELDMFADVGTLPDLVVVFGSRPWDYVWPAFGRPQPSWAVSFRPTPGPLYDHLVRVTFTHPDGARPMVVAKVRHPAAYRNGMTASALVAHADFKAALETDFASK